MNLETYNDPSDLYLARGDDVNPNRPFFTGDVFSSLAIPGVQDDGMAMIIAHPCSFRAGRGELADRLLLARVEPTARQGKGAWVRGFLDRMPLPDVDGDGHFASRLDLIGLTKTVDLLAARRIACLSEFGINLLQQRLTCHLTRAEIPTHNFHDAFSHTFEEADLLEDWNDTLIPAGWTTADAAAAFEAFIRSGDPSLQSRLRDPQHRPSVRRACRAEAVDIAHRARP